MKKINAVMLCVLLIVFMAAGCAPPQTAPAPDPVELTVFAAASMTEAMNEIAQLYKTVNPRVTLIYNFDSSGTLKTQIEQGADCDIFISAGQKQMNELDAAADPAVNVDRLDFVLQGSRFNIVSNKVVMIVPASSGKGIAGFNDVMTDKVSLIALGNSDVPVGQYAQEICTYLGVWDELNAAKKISFGTNVKEVLEQVKSGAADCGIVYGTDAATADGVRVVSSAPEGSHKAVTYPAAILKAAKNRAEAEAFASFLKGPECAKVFEAIGFSIPER